MRWKFAGSRCTSRSFLYKSAADDGVALEVCGRGLPMRNGSGSGPGGETGDIALCSSGSSCAMQIAAQVTTVHITVVMRRNRRILLD